jgi:hypothetical protein
MEERNAADPELGKELFRCRPKLLRDFFALRYQGALPSYKWLNFLKPALVITSPILETLILTGLPTILLIFLLQVILGLKPPTEPVWVRPVCFAALVIPFPVMIWWYWIAPCNDDVIVYERGFRWRISLSRWEWFRSQGSVIISDLKAFSYRSDCFEPESVDWGKTHNDRLARLRLEVNLSHYDIAFHLKNESNIVVEKFFARFDQADVPRLLDHLATSAERLKITV